MGYKRDENSQRQQRARAYRRKRESEPRPQILTRQDHDKRSAQRHLSLSDQEKKLSRLDDFLKANPTLDLEEAKRHFALLDGVSQNVGQA